MEDGEMNGRGAVCRVQKYSKYKNNEKRFKLHPR